MFNKTKTLEIACWSVLAALLQSCDLGTKSSPAALEDGEVVESKIADGAVTNAKLSTAAVRRPNIGTGAVDMTKIDPAINFSTTGSITGSTLNVSGASSLAAATLSGNLTVGSNKLTVDATTGNSVVAGTLNVAGAGTFGTLSTGETTLSSTGTLPTLLLTRTDTSTGNTSGADHRERSQTHVA